VIVVTGTARFEASGEWRFPNPTRSFVLGDPAGGRLVYGGQFELLDVDEIVPGSSGRAIARLVVDSLPSTLGPVPIWSGHIIGEFTPEPTTL
jgi:hypothetical protein